MYLIRFEYPEGGDVYAGRLSDGSLGWAPTPESALRCDTREEAERWIEAYPSSKEYAVIVDVDPVSE